MTIQGPNSIVSLVNGLLAGEQLSYTQMKPHLDAVIDDINSALNSKFPTFSSLPDNVTDYMFFPDRYVRTVVAFGAAYHFFLMDEEGAPTAMGYAQRFKQNLFYMTRDYLHAVPLVFRDCDKNSVIEPNATDSSISGLGLERI